MYKEIVIGFLLILQGKWILFSNWLWKLKYLFAVTAKSWTSTCEQFMDKVEKVENHGLEQLLIDGKLKEASHIDLCSR